MERKPPHNHVESENDNSFSDFFGVSDWFDLFPLTIESFLISLPTAYFLIAKTHPESIAFVENYLKQYLYKLIH